VPYIKTKLKTSCDKACPDFIPFSGEWIWQIFTLQILGSYSGKVVDGILACDFGSYQRFKKHTVSVVNHEDGESMLL
jgi:hypothetical protein